MSARTGAEPATLERGAAERPRAPRPLSREETMKTVTVRIDGADQTVPDGTLLAVAIARAGGRFRRSVGGAPRAPLCGMGICYECRVTVDGARHQLACLIVCRDGMEVESGD